MGMQIQTSIQIQKLIKNVNFLSSTTYEKYDLRQIIKQNQKVIVRQGDLVITNKPIQNFAIRGLRYAHLRNVNGYETFRSSHIILTYEKYTAIFHNEHGLIIIPFRKEELEFYTFENSID